MKKWEYKIVKFSTVFDQKKVEETLNSSGNEGWKIIHIDSSGIVLMEQEKIEESPESIKEIMANLR